MSTTWRANALPSFVAGGTYTACIRQPLIVVLAIVLTRAPGYQAGPLTTLAASLNGLGDALSTRCWSAVVLGPTTQPRHVFPQPPSPPGPMMWSTHPLTPR